MLNKAKIEEDIKTWAQRRATAQSVRDTPEDESDFQDAMQDIQEAENELMELRWKLNMINLVERVEAANIALQYALLGNPVKHNFTEEDRRTVGSVTKILTTCAQVIQNIE